MSTKSFLLDTTEMEDKFFSGTALPGIGSSLPIYRLCWLFNTYMGTNFARLNPEQDIVLQAPKKEPAYFPLYQYDKPLMGIKHSVYKLKSGKAALLPEIKQLDYIWFIESDYAESEANTIVKHIKTLPDIQLAQVLSSDKLKHLNHLIV